MLKFDIPAIGYQTRKKHSRLYDAYLRKRFPFEYLYKSEELEEMFMRRKYALDTYIFDDLMKKCIGYVPLIGIFTGVDRWGAVEKCEFPERMDKFLTPEGVEISKKLKRLHNARALMECLGIGSLFLIPDIIATIAYNINNR